MPDKTNYSDATQREQHTVYAQSNARPMGIPFAQYASEVPSAPRATVRSPAIKPTARSADIPIRRNSILVSWWQNTPVFDLTLSVSKIAKWIETSAFNYQRTHQDAFFQQYPQLILLNATDQATFDNANDQTAWLRQNYRKLAKHAAHEIYYYLQFSNFYTAALLNMLNLTRLNGQEPVKDIASSFRWSYINTNTAYYSRFPKTTGVEARMAELTRWGMGTSTMGAEIVGFSLWNTDIMGNRGCHVHDLNSLFALDNRALDSIVTHGNPWTGDKTTDHIQLTGNTPVGTITDDGQRSSDLIQNIQALIATYETNMFGFRSPRIENGATMWCETNDTHLSNSCYLANLNLSGSVDNLDVIEFPQHAAKHNDNIIGSIWRSYKQIEKILYTQFPLFTDVNSDWYQITVREMKVCQESSKPEDLLKVIRDSKFVDLVSIADKLTFKKNNNLTTATLVRFPAPFVQAADIDKDWHEKDFKTGPAFNANYERIQTDALTPGQVVASGIPYPTITPTVFTDAAKDPDNFNATPTPIIVNGPISFGPATHDVPVAESIIGKNQVILDMVSTSNFATESSGIDGVQIASDDLLSFIKDCTSLTIEENPSQPKCYVTPVFDNSDIYQCGFNLIVSREQQVNDEFTKFYTDQNNYETYKDTYNADSDDISTGPTFADQPDNGKYPNMHIANPSYLGFIGHTMVFVGGAIFNHPLVSMTNPVAGFPYSYLNVPAVQITQGLQAVSDFFGVISTELHDGDPTGSAAAIPFILLLAGQMNVDESSINDPISGIIGKLFYATTLHNGKFDDDRLRIYAFDPRYGAIAPITKGAMFDYIRMYDMFTISGMNDRLITGNAHKDAIYSVAYRPNIATHEEGFVVRHASDDRAQPARSDLICAYNYLQFIAALSAKVATLDSTGYTRVIDKEPFAITLQPYANWVQPIVSRTHIAFPGIEDMIPFWTGVADANVTQWRDETIKDCSDIPSIDLVTEPKIKPASHMSNHIVPKFAGETKQVRSSDAMVINASFGTGSDNSVKRETKYGKHGKGKKHAKRDFHKSGRSTRYDDNINISNNKSEDGNQDFSTTAEDKVFNSAKERKVDGVSLQA